MTEAEWLESTDLHGMLIHLRGEIEPAEREPDPRPRSIGSQGDLVAGPATRTTASRLARFARECVSRWRALPLDEASGKLVSRYEDFLESRLTWTDFLSVCEESQPGGAFVTAFNASQWSTTPFGVSHLAGDLACMTSRHVHRERIAELERTATEDDRFAWGFFGYDFPEYHATTSTLLGPLPDLLREVVGNPFRPVEFDPSWKTSTTTALACSMYTSLDFAAAPVLADALEDAGCDNASILEHLRGKSCHVRGCWAVDIVLGTS